VEFGAWTGLVAPDDTTIGDLAGRPNAPQGAAWDASVAHWRSLSSVATARFDRERAFDAATLAPRLRWGTRPEHTVGIHGRGPDPAQARDAAQRTAQQRALDCLGLALNTRAFPATAGRGRRPDLPASAAGQAAAAGAPPASTGQRSSSSAAGSGGANL
jgi:3-isopropylmalate/(R)-2-methylmalate dehydratase large subunit